MKQLGIFIMVMGGFLATATLAQADHIRAAADRLRGDARGGVHDRQGPVPRHNQR